MIKSAVNQRFIDAVNYLISSNNSLNKSIIASKIDISKSKFSEILNGRMNVGIEQIIKLSEIYDISLDFILLGKGEVKKSSNQNVRPVESLNRAEGDSDYRLIIEEQKNIITALKDQVEFYKTQHTTDNDTIDYIKNRTDDIYEFITTQEALREFDKIFEKAVQLGKDKAKEKGLEDLMNKIEALKK